MVHKIVFQVFVSLVLLSCNNENPAQNATNVAIFEKIEPVKT
ncbi:MAG: hypothetical protein ACI8VT_001807, partial [Saprospiraceae bacterium]